MAESFTTIKVSTGQIIGGPLVASKEDIGIDLWCRVGASVHDKLPDLINTTRRNPHPNLMRIYWIFPTIGRNEFMIFYYKEDHAERLKEWLTNDHFKELSLSQQIDLLNGLIEGVQHLHNHGLIHRDITPDNIWVVRDETNGTIKFMLGDYELVEPIGQECKICRVGTEGFNPRESYFPDLIADVRYDVFGLAATVMYILTGGTTIPSNYYGEMSGDSYNRLRQLYSIEVADVFKKAMSLRRDDRFPSVEIFWFFLKDALQNIESTGI